MSAISDIKLRPLERGDLHFVHKINNNDVIMRYWFEEPYEAYDELVALHQVDVNNLQFGQSAAVFLLVSLLGTAMTLCVAYFIRHWRWVQWIGTNTLLILCTHTLVFLVVTSVVARTGVIDRHVIGTPIWAMGLCVVAVAACVPMRAVLVRIAPWMLGLKGK